MANEGSYFWRKYILIVLADHSLCGTLTTVATNPSINGCSLHCLQEKNIELLEVLLLHGTLVFMVQSNETEFCFQAIYSQL